MVDHPLIPKDVKEYLQTHDVGDADSYFYQGLLQIDHIAIELNN